MDASDRRFFVILYVTYFIVALLFNAFTPIGEAPDELAHYQYMRIVHDEQRLPGSRDGLYEGHQAPIYYITQASWAYLLQLMTGCDIRPDRMPSRSNPNFMKGNDLNFLVHAASERLSNWGCTEFTFHMLRLFSALLTLLMIVLTVRLLMEVLPSSPTTVKLAATIVALLPSHVFISTMVNNDSLVNVLIVAAMYYLARTLRTFDIDHFIRGLVAMAMAVATKMSAIFMFPLFTILLLIKKDLRRRMLNVRFDTGWTWVVAAAVALPFVLFLRNYLEWGDPFGLNVLERYLSMAKKAGMNPPGSIIDYYLHEVPAAMARGFFVGFGVINFFDGPALVRLQTYGLAIAIGIVVSFGWQRGLLWRNAAGTPLLFLMLGFGLFFMTYLYPGYKYRLLQARFFFHQLPLLSLVAGIGITALWQEAKRVIPRLQDRVIVYGQYGFLLVMNVLVLVFGVIEHLYKNI